MKAPITIDGKTKIYEETFKSPPNYPTKDFALHALENIRKAHPKKHGWNEVEAYVKQFPDGKWQAVRHHAKYK